MYRASEHKLLLQILSGIERKHGSLNSKDSLEFITRLSANFSNLRDLFSTVYGDADSAQKPFRKLITTLYSNYVQRSHVLKTQDSKREDHVDWLSSQHWVGMSLYTEHFSKDLKGLVNKIDYLEDLGVNLVHLMPILKSPRKERDGGYSISDYRKITPHLGKISDLTTITEEFRKRGMLLILDLVLNHTSDQHIWARKAREGHKTYRDYYHMYPDRSLPDLFEARMPEIFPETAPGSFTFLPEQKQWVMTVFNHFQWDLNYGNPNVLIEMIDVMLFLANQGVDILRLDAAPYLWKEVGTSCQNHPKAHTILQLMKRCTEVVAPGLKFMAESIVAPSEIVKYLGHQDQPECDMAYNATLMALIWNSLATTKTDLLYKSLGKLPEKPEGTTWINYIRCHDDIGLGFDDEDIYQIGLDARMHRAFLLSYYTGRFEGSMAKGALFMYNPSNGDARLSGSLASLAGLEKSIEDRNIEQANLSIKKILLTHALIMSYGGLPMIYSGDEIGMLNQYDYLDDPHRKTDNRWMHRAIFDWDAASKRSSPGTLPHRIFSELQKLIDLRKNTIVWADHNNTRLVYSDNQHLLAFIRFATETDRTGEISRVLVLMNFDARNQSIGYEILVKAGLDQYKAIYDLYSGNQLKINNGFIELQPYQFYFITEMNE